MTDKFREAIEKAAAQANARITAVREGRYNPKIEVRTPETDRRQRPSSEV